MRKTYVINNRLGFHVLPSKRLALAAEKFECDMELRLGDSKGNPKKMIEVLKLGMKRGDHVTLITSGKDEAAAQEELGELLSQG